MAAPSLKPVGLWSDRIDQLQIRIPKHAVDKTTQQERARDDERLPEGWNQQEQVVQTQGELRHEKSAAWRRFHGGNRRANYGAILIDSPPQPKTLAPATAAPPDDSSGWQRIDRWHGHAARFEEQNRGKLDQLGAESNELDPSSPAAPRRRAGQSKKRRRFTIA